MSRSVKTRPFDPAEFLATDDMLATFLADAFDAGDQRVFQEALQVAARARGMAGIAELSGLGRESLYKALRPDAQPRFDTIRRVIEALGCTLSFGTTPAPRRASVVRDSGAGYAVARPAPRKAAKGVAKSTASKTAASKKKPAKAAKSAKALKAVKPVKAAAKSSKAAVSKSAKAAPARKSAARKNASRPRAR